MVRSLWSAATGMNAQQTNVDTIANNLANVNSMGYKAQEAEFKSLLYQTLQTKSTVENAGQPPVNSDVGLGVRTASINSRFTQGAFLDSASNTAFAIGGDGFFAYRNDRGEQVYTRNGDFIWAIAQNGTNDITLTTSEGYHVLDSQGREITLRNMVSNRVVVDADGNIQYPDANNVPQNTGFQIGRWQFNNPTGLERVGDTSFLPTQASGQPMNELTQQNLQRSVIRQGYLEGSNVNVATEMVNLIVAQRAYEMNSKAITTTDEMMQTANNLKR
ncbi:MAG: flagellar hook-basal body protein [Lachnospiraceae bacterium]|nr:flagellar hook-basal body protein [Lachnospiraceae bacterium]